LLNNSEIAELSRQLYLAADEYTSFRNIMMSSPTITAQQVEGCIKRSDRMAALLRIIRGKLALLESQ
jgi:hypothetical protein